MPQVFYFRILLLPLIIMSKDMIPIVPRSRFNTLETLKLVVETKFNQI